MPLVWLFMGMSVVLWRLLQEPEQQRSATAADS